MQGISSWLLSIAGIICLSVLIELVLPNGQINKYIKSILAFAIIFVIISPFPNFIGQGIDNIVFEKKNIQLQEDYLYNLNVSKLSATQQNLITDLNKAGYKDVNISISADLNSSNIIYNKIYVDLKDIVITEDAQHKNILDVKEDIKRYIFEIFGKVEVIFEDGS